MIHHLAVAGEQAGNLEVWRPIIIENGARAQGFTESRVHGSRQPDRERFIRLGKRIVEDLDDDGLIGLAGRKVERAVGGRIVTTGERGSVGCRVIHRHGVGACSRKSDAEQHVRGSPIRLANAHIVDGKFGHDDAGGVRRGVVASPVVRFGA